MLGPLWGFGLLDADLEAGLATLLEKVLLSAAVCVFAAGTLLAAADCALAANDPLGTCPPLIFAVFD